MPYLLTCSCGEEHAITTSQAGQELICSCGKTLRIPTLRGIRELPQSGSTPQAKPIAKSTSTWGGWRGPALAIASGISLFTALTACYFLIQRARIDTSFNADAAVELADELLDQYGPYELSYVWNTYQSDGLGPKQRPEFYLWNRYAEELVFRAIVMGSIAAVSACIALGIWLTVKRN